MITEPISKPTIDLADAFPILFSMLAIRMPIGLAMLIVGGSGTILISGCLPILSQVKTSAWHLFSNYSLSVIPLFLLMGNFAGKAGMSEALFKFTGACLCLLYTSPSPRDRG